MNVAIAEGFTDPRGSVEEELAKLRLQCRRLVKENESLKLNETRLLAENFQLRNQLYWARNMQTAFHNWLHHKSQGEQVSTAECKTRVQWMGNALDGATPLMVQPSVKTPPPTPPQTWRGSLLSVELAETRVAPWIKRMVVTVPTPKPSVSGESSLPQGELSKAERASDPTPEPVQERVEAAERPQITIIMPGEKDGFDEAHRREDLEERIARKIDESNARILAKMQAEFGTPQQPTNIIMIGATSNDAK